MSSAITTPLVGYYYKFPRRKPYYVFIDLVPGIRGRDNTTRGARISWYKTKVEVLGLSVGGLFATPVQLVARVIYNVLRIPYVILLIFFSPSSWGKEWGFIPKKMTIEIARSIGRIIEAPFYALALCFAHLIAFFVAPFSAYHAKEIPAKVEAASNHNISISKAFWACEPKRYFKWEGRSVESLHEGFAIYAHGCYQSYTTADVVHEKNRIMYVYSRNKRPPRKTYLGWLL